MGNFGKLPGQLGQGVLHGEGIAGGAAHAINPTLGKIYDTANALAGMSLGIPPGALGTSHMGGPSSPAMMAPQPVATSQAPQFTTGPSSPAQMAPQSPATGSPFGNISPQLLRLIQMLAQQGVPGLPTV